MRSKVGDGSALFGDQNGGGGGVGGCDVDEFCRLNMGGGSVLFPGDHMPERKTFSQNINIRRN